jgi:hypothetical protein
MKNKMTSKMKMKIKMKMTRSSEKDKEFPFTSTPFVSHSAALLRTLGTPNPNRHLGCHVERDSLRSIASVMLDKNRRIKRNWENNESSCPQQKQQLPQLPQLSPKSNDSIIKRISTCFNRLVSDGINRSKA